MTTNIQIRDQEFDIDEIENISIHWKDEIEVQELTITMFNGETFHFTEEHIKHPMMGDLHSAFTLYKELKGIQ